MIDALYFGGSVTNKDSQFYVPKSTVNSSGQLAFQLKLPYKSKIKQVLIMYFDDDAVNFDQYYMVYVGNEEVTETSITNLPMSSSGF